MKRSMQIILVMSLAFNFGFLGAFLYHLIEKPRYNEMVKPSPERPPQFLTDNSKLPDRKPVLHAEQKRALHQIRRQFQSRIQETRQRLFKEKRALADMLIQEGADSVQIDSQIQLIGELEIQIEKAVLFELIHEAQILSPEERSAFIRLALQRLEGVKKRPQTPLNRPPKRDRPLRPYPERQNQRRNQP